MTGSQSEFYIASVCVICVCVRVCFCLFKFFCKNQFELFFNSAGHEPAREITISGRKKEEKVKKIKTI